MALSRFSSLSVIFYMPYRPLRAYGGYTCLCQAVSYMVETLSAVFAFVVLAFSTCNNATHHK